LKAGWNEEIVYFSSDKEKDALEAVQPLIDADVLTKVTSYDGGSIIKFFGNWKNSIGNLKPGETYRIQLKEGVEDIDFSWE